MGTGRSKLYEFDKILDENTSQSESFQFVAKRMCDNVVSGKNGCVLAYGQTSAGKTYSLLGPEPLIQTMKMPETHGVLLRSYNYLESLKDSSNIKNLEIEISFMEIYMGRTYDLIENYTDDLKTKKKLVKIMQMEDESTVYKNLTKHQVGNTNELIKLLGTASSNRTKAEHNLNSTSSRSHCLVTFYVKTTKSDGQETTAKLLFADLAG